ncbi:MAG: VWA domain-containing protein [Acidobacteria bacterium]|nr:MAG: VWA domain-containing protein [Acidobacteriota bacterium]REK05577.1 MAG: VWA domain-containing protein [Acidobacteriota bacterium]
MPCQTTRPTPPSSERRPTTRRRPAVSLRRQAATASVALMALVALVALAAAPLGAQRTLPGFAEAIDVRVVNLEVVVTDRDGNRVTGLGPEQFLLEVDGEATAIDFFSEVRDGRAIQRSAAGNAEGPGAIGGVADGEALRTNYLVFVDDYFSIARDRDRVLDNLRQQLTALGALDRVAIVAYDGRTIDLISNWTGDRSEIAAALDRAQRRDAFGTQRLAELRTNDLDRRQRAELALTNLERLEQTGELPDPNFMDTRLQPVELAYANRLTDQVEKSVLAAVSTLRSFAGPPGRRVMLLLSGGWPLSTPEYTVNDLRATAAAVGAGSLDNTFPGPGELYEPLVDTANLLGYTLYPIDVPGQNREIGVSAEEGLGDFERLDPTVGAGSGATAREVQVHQALGYIADRTGGRALLNSQRDEALQRAVEDTRTFYWLGFTPKRNEDDAAHSIEVQIVGRPDLRVRARDGFVDLSRGAEVTMMVESALLFGDPPTNKPLALEFGKPQKRRGKIDLPLEVGISLDEITLIPQNGQWINELEIRVTVMDAVGNRSETQLDTIPIAGDYQPRPGQSWFYETTLRLRDREHRIVVAVYDPISGAILSSSAELQL